MRKTILVFSFIILVMSVFIVSAAVAECPEGKTMVTVTTPPGKVIEICVPDTAVDDIGGPGDVVVPAICPCFTQEDLEEAITSYRITCATMTIYPNNADGYGRVFASVFTNAPDVIFMTELNTGEWSTPGVRFGLEGIPDNTCLEPVYRDYSWCYSETTGEQVPTSVEQAEACVALLRATFDWVEIP